MVWAEWKSQKGFLSEETWFHFSAGAQAQLENGDAAVASVQPIGQVTSDLNLNKCTKSTNRCTCLILSWHRLNLSTSSSTDWLTVGTTDVSSLRNTMDNFIILMDFKDFISWKHYLCKTWIQEMLVEINKIQGLSSVSWQLGFLRWGGMQVRCCILIPRWSFTFFFSLAVSSSLSLSVEEDALQIADENKTKNAGNQITIVQWWIVANSRHRVITAFFEETFSDAVHPKKLAKGGSGYSSSSSCYSCWGIVYNKKSSLNFGLHIQKNTKDSEKYLGDSNELSKKDPHLILVEIF